MQAYTVLDLFYKADEVAHWQMGNLMFFVVPLLTYYFY